LLQVSLLTWKTYRAQLMRRNHKKRLRASFEIINDCINIDIIQKNLNTKQGQSVQNIFIQKKL
jgi:hypothetical protein